MMSEWSTCIQKQPESPETVTRIPPPPPPQKTCRKTRAAQDDCLARVHLARGWIIVKWSSWPCIRAVWKCLWQSNAIVGAKMRSRVVLWLVAGELRTRLGMFIIIRFSAAQGDQAFQRIPCIGPLHSGAYIPHALQYRWDVQNDWLEDYRKRSYDNDHYLDKFAFVLHHLEPGLS